MFRGGTLTEVGTRATWNKTVNIILTFICMIEIYHIFYDFKLLVCVADLILTYCFSVPLTQSLHQSGVDLKGKMTITSLFICSPATFFAYANHMSQHVAFPYCMYMLQDVLFYACVVEYVAFMYMLHNMLFFR